MRMGAGSSRSKIVEDGRQIDTSKVVFNIKLLAESRQPEDPFTIFPEDLTVVILRYLSLSQTCTVHSKPNLRNSLPGEEVSDISVYQLTV